MFAPLLFSLLLARLSIAIQLHFHPDVLEINPPSRVTPTQARLMVSYHLGVDLFGPNDDALNDPLAHELNRKPFVGQGPQKALVLSMEETLARDILSSQKVQSFLMRNPESPSDAVSDVVSTIQSRARYAYPTVMSTTSELPPSSASRVLDIFGLSDSFSTEEFVHETAVLSYFLEMDDQNAFGAFELKGLMDIAVEHGKSSEQYKLALETSRAVLSSAAANNNIHVAVITYPSPSTSFTKRDDPPKQSPFPAPPPQQPIGSVSTCFASAEDCGNSTSSCSGRGQCVQATKAGKTCFLCACSPTKDSKGHKQVWVGEACERKDISGPFALLTGTAVALIVLVAGSVGLLLGVGGEALPPTLTATTGPLRRD